MAFLTCQVILVMHRHTQVGQAVSMHCPGKRFVITVFHCLLFYLHNAFFCTLCSLGFFSRLTGGGDSSGIEGLNRCLVSLLSGNSTRPELSLDSLVGRGLSGLGLVLNRDGSSNIREMPRELYLVQLNIESCRASVV
jgi:hypothetical protein